VTDALELAKSKWRVVLAVSVGNALEWFDFVIFGYFALAIAKQFFPASDPVSSLLMSLAVFGAAFVMRPLGAIAIGYYADRAGRKPALTLTITLMMVGTALIACAPPYEVIGPLAPLVIVAGRLIQGFSAGGEFGSATALLAEQHPDHRGFFASWQFASQAMSVVLATSFGAALASVLDGEQLDNWGWRIPFLFGVLIGPIALYIRYRIPESQEFRSLPRNGETPRHALLSSGWAMFTALGLVIVATVTVYTLVLTPTFAVQYLGYPLRDVFVVGLATGVVQTVLIPIAGFLSDKWGRLPLAAGAALVIFGTALPLLTLVATTRTFAALLAFQIWIGAQLAIYLGALPALMAELFPTRIRTTGLAVSYSLAVAVFGGFTPVINASLIELLGTYAAPSFYLMAAAVVSLIAMAAAHRNLKKSSPDSRGGTLGQG
jgi:MHS family proline/betaine transporter-like MFS transporter